MEFNSLFGLGRVYKKLPPHDNFKELADNIETLANHFLDRGSRNALSGGAVTWEWKLGEDLKMLLEYARAYVPDDADGLHYFGQRQRKLQEG